jgi:NADH-ubiquinone oxidoreductase chain 5
MYLAIIVLPLLGSIVSGFFGRKVGVTGAQFITSLCIAILIFYEAGLNGIPVSVLTFRWVDSESLNVLWGFNFDSLTVSMLIPVLIISFLVHIYSIGYMSHDPHNQRFFSYLSLFTFMMIILVTANNFLLMFVGWEGVGVCSYLLVSFWFTRMAANQSSMSAFLTNRVGDCFLTLGMFVMLLVFGNLDYTTIFSLAPFVSENIVSIIGICLLIGAMAKSSQIGLHVWLPLAMEGPTPVSALIHAATMVTAGVYLLMRASPVIEYSSTVLILCLWIGGITTIFSSLIGLFQQDIKKVIAYSTMSQLGMMVIAVGLSSYNIALFHLVNHAFYKGLLFLGAGAVIHAVADNQDFRRYGGFLIFLPLTYTVMLIASLSLMAFPFMTGFYSKDFILESAYGQYEYSGITIYFVATIGAVFTTLYSVKVLYLTFLSKANGPLVSYQKIHESDMFMSLPLIILALFSIFFGYITKDMFIGLASGFFVDNSLFIHPSHEIMLETEFAVLSLFKLLPLILTIIFTIYFFGLLELLPLFIVHLKYTRLVYNLYCFFNLRFLVDYIYNRFVTGFVLKLGGQTSKILDKGSVELLGPYGLEMGLFNISKNISKLDTGVVTSYALYILIALVLYVQIPYIYSEDISVLLLILVSLIIVTNTYFSDNTYLSESKLDNNGIYENNVDVYKDDNIDRFT